MSNNLRETALDFLRRIFGKEKESDKWSILRQTFSPKEGSIFVDTSPSQAEIRTASMFNVYSKEDIASVLNKPLWNDRYCDYEYMEPYPDLNYGYADDAVMPENYKPKIEVIAADKTAKDEVVDKLIGELKKIIPKPFTKTYDAKKGGFSQTGTTIGRLSSKELNLSNLPREEKEEKFVPTRENCGCSGRDLLFSGHKCGFFPKS